MQERGEIGRKGVLPSSLKLMMMIIVVVVVVPVINRQNQLLSYQLLLINLLITVAYESAMSG